VLDKRGSTHINAFVSLLRYIWCRLQQTYEALSTWEAYGKRTFTLTILFRVAIMKRWSTPPNIIPFTSLLFAPTVDTYDFDRWSPCTSVPMSLGGIQVFLGNKFRGSLALFFGSGSAAAARSLAVWCGSSGSVCVGLI
jgi:hypothetical protein